MKRAVLSVALLMAVPTTALAETGKSSDASPWIAMVVILLLFASAITSGGKSNRKKPDRMTRASAIDNWLYDKGMTYRNGHEYETYVAWWLGTRGYKNILITPKSGDYGADIICYDRRGVKCAVQCKYYSKPVGYRAVEEALGAMHYYGCGRAVVVTNNVFTRQAIDAAKRTGVELMSRVR